MAPRKRSSDGEALEPPQRVTRSSTGRLSRYVNRTSVPTPLPTPPKKRIAKKPKTDPDAVKETDGGKTVVIEHCKQCNSFKTRAVQVKKGLEDGVPGITVLVNPETPRRGCFEIREEGGEKFITLLDMPRPFKPMKDLDMEKVVTDIIEKIK